MANKKIQFYNITETILHEKKYYAAGGEPINADDVLGSELTKKFVSGGVLVKIPTVYELPKSANTIKELKAEKAKVKEIAEKANAAAGKNAKKIAASGKVGIAATLRKMAADEYTSYLAVIRDIDSKIVEASK